MCRGRAGCDPALTQNTITRPGRGVRAFFYWAFAMAHRRSQATASAGVASWVNRVAVNRTVAGVHYPMDSRAGATIGSGVASVIIALGQNKKPKLNAQVLDVNAADQQGADFFLDDAKALYDVHDAADTALAEPTAISWLWGKAVEDMKHLATGAA